MPDEGGGVWGQLARKIRQNEELRSEIERIKVERDMAVNCIEEIQRALENSDAGLALAEIQWYRERTVR